MKLTPEQENEILRLYFIQDFYPSEIAKAMNLSIKVVYKVIREVRELEESK